MSIQNCLLRAIHYVANGEPSWSHFLHASMASASSPKRDLGNGIRILVDESTFPEQKLSENLGGLPVGGVESP